MDVSIPGLPMEPAQGIGAKAQVVENGCAPAGQEEHLVKKPQDRDVKPGRQPQAEGGPPTAVEGKVADHQQYSPGEQQSIESRRQCQQPEPAVLAAPVGGGQEQSQEPGLQGEVEQSLVFSQRRGQGQLPEDQGQEAGGDAQQDPGGGYREPAPCAELVEGQEEQKQQRDLAAQIEGEPAVPPGGRQWRT